MVFMKVAIGIRIESALSMHSDILRISNVF